MICGRMIAVSANLSLKLAMLMMKIYNSLYLGKWKGKTAFQRFRAIKGDDYEFINICSEDPEKLARIEKEMEAHNLLFAKLPDLCGGDGNTQYVIARSDMNIFSAFLMDHLHGELDKHPQYVWTYPHSVSLLRELLGFWKKLLSCGI